MQDPLDRHGIALTGTDHRPVGNHEALWFVRPQKVFIDNQIETAKKKVVRNVGNIYQPSAAATPPCSVISRNCVNTRTDRSIISSSGSRRPRLA